MAHYITDASGKLMKVSGNGYSNLDCLRTKILWTNPNPSSSFETQTITLSSDDYDYLVLIPTHNIANQIKAPACIMSKGTGGRIVSADASSNSTYIPMVMARDVTRVSDTQFTISSCRYNYGSTYTETRNDLLVPYQIIGLYKQPAMIYTGAELHEGNGVSIKDGVISQSPVNIAINSYYIGGNPEIVANASKSEASVVSLTINKQYETSKLLVMSSVPIKNNDQGWGGGISVKVDGVTKCIKRVVSYSGDVNLDWLIPDISSGVHTVSLNVLYGGGSSGAGSVSMPQYSNAVIIVEEVLV